MLHRGPDHWYNNPQGRTTEKILEVIRAHPKETAPEIAKRVGKSADHVMNCAKRAGISLPKAPLGRSRARACSPSLSAAVPGKAETSSVLEKAGPAHG